MRRLFILILLMALSAGTLTFAQRERAPGQQAATASAGAGVSEQAIRHGRFRVDKYRPKQKPRTVTGQGGPESSDDVEELELYETIEFENAYVNTGGAAFLDRLIGTGATAFDNTNAYLGVGDSSTATSASMTDLQAASNKLRKAMDSTFPSRSSQVMTWKSTFGSSEGNFAWQEVALFNASSSGTMLSRGTSSLGTKASSTTWVLTYTITIP